MSSRLNLDVSARGWLAPVRRSAAAVVRSSRRTLSVLAVVAVVLTALAATAWVADARRSGLESSREDATKAATAHLATLFSYDYRSIAGIVEDRRDLVTGKFAGEYAGLVTDQVAPTAKSRQVVTRTDVVTTSVVDASSDEVELLVFLNQVSATKKSKVPVLSGSRVRVVMKKVDDQWRVADVKPV